MWLEQPVREWELSGWWRNSWRAGAPGPQGPAGQPLVGPIVAQVPGAVQADLLRANLIRDMNKGLASAEAEWVEHRDWIFQTRLTVPPAGSRHVLCFEGLDQTGEIYVGNVCIKKFQGMFRPVEVDVTQFLKEEKQGCEVRVVFLAPPPEIDGQIGWTSRVRELKSRFNYEWDWCPRIVPIGFWDDVCLRTYGPVRLMDSRLRTDWDPVRQRGILQIVVQTSGPGILRTKVLDGERIVFEDRYIIREPGTPSNVHVELAVKPWTVAELGSPQSYRLILELYDPNGELSDCLRRVIGFRRLVWEKNPGAPAGALSYTVRVNDQRVFLKGVNWVPISPLYGTVDTAQYRNWLERFRRMGVNFVRVWGGAIVEKEAFYDLCDELGIMVWQELLQSSSGIDNLPPDDADFITELGEVSRIAVRRRRHHPALIAWCGGNELIDDHQRPVDCNHPNLAHLHKVIAEEDGTRPFFPSSPSGPAFSADISRMHEGRHHDVHGPWEYLGDPDHYTYFNQDDALLRTEVGTAGASRTRLLHRLADGHALWPPAKTEAIWRHHGAWWVPWDVLTRWFGPWNPNQENLDHFVALSRYLQAESIRYMVEATRRRAPEASGVVIWMGNEPYANFSNTSLLEYDGVPKPAYSAVRRAFNPSHVSLQYEKLAYEMGDLFVATLFSHTRMHSAHLTTLPTGRLYSVDGKVLAESSETSEGSRSRLQWTVDEVPESVFLARVEGDGTTYVFAVRSTHAAPLAPLRHLPPATLEATWHAQSERRCEVSITNTGPVAAIAIEMTSDEGWWDIWPNAITLLPGEHARVVAENLGSDGELCLELEGLNVRNQAIAPPK